MRKILWRLWTLAVVWSFAFGSPLRVRSPYAVKSSHSLPSQWRKIGPASSEHVMTLQIGLKQGQFHQLERHLYEGKLARLRLHCHQASLLLSSYFFLNADFAE